VIILITYLLRTIEKNVVDNGTCMYAKHGKLRQPHCRLTAIPQELPRISAYTLYF